MKKILLAAILSVGTTTMAFAAPIEMTATQLDQVTAGQTLRAESTTALTGSLRAELTTTLTGSPTDIDNFLGNFNLVATLSAEPKNPLARLSSCRRG